MSQTENRAMKLSLGLFSTKDNW